MASTEDTMRQYRERISLHERPRSARLRSRDCASDSRVPKGFSWATIETSMTQLTIRGGGSVVNLNSLSRLAGIEDKNCALQGDFSMYVSPPYGDLGGHQI